MIRLHLRIPRYRSEGSGEGMETPLDSWLRYWVVVSCAAIPDILLDSLELLPHHDTLRTVFICWCLCPGPLSGTEILFNQVSLTNRQNLDQLHACRYFQFSPCSIRLVWQLLLSQYQ